MEGYYLLETAACARAGLQASYDLYRTIARWGTTTGLVSPNVVEGPNGDAVVLVTGRVSIDALDPEQRGQSRPGLQYPSVLIDATGNVSRALGSELERTGGYYLEEAGGKVADVADAVYSWWSIQEDDILRKIRESF